MSQLATYSSSPLNAASKGQEDTARQRYPQVAMLASRRQRPATVDSGWGPFQLPRPPQDISGSQSLGPGNATGAKPAIYLVLLTRHCLGCFELARILSSIRAGSPPMHPETRIVVDKAASHSRYKFVGVVYLTRFTQHALNAVS
jgi:hypothetical protein